MGSVTGWRWMMPGAFTSTRPRVLVSIGPLPSMGMPSALTTRPTTASPTGTSMMRPVRFTVSPSLMTLVSPKMAAPTLSCSRLSTRPISVSPLCPMNSMSSPAIARDRPWTRAMPSPTVSTVPVSETSAALSMFWICFLMIWEISSARSCIGAVLFEFAD